MDLAPVFGSGACVPSPTPTRCYGRAKLARIAFMVQISHSQAVAVTQPHQRWALARTYAWPADVLLEGSRCHRRPAQDTFNGANFSGGRSVRVGRSPDTTDPLRTGCRCRRYTRK